MKIATYNVNSVRRRLPIVIDWLALHKPDIMCLQETKVQDHEFPVEAFREAGYFAAFRGMKGYNGVATLSREQPGHILYGFHEGPDNEDVRLLTTVIGGVAIVNSYVPQGYAVGSDKYAGKLAWLAGIRRYFDEQLDPKSPAIWLGDLNVAPEPIDVYHPDKRGNDPDFHIDARNAWKEAVSWGFTDVFRKLHPDRVQYTYWDYFRNAYARNFGWRIDHILATAPLAARCTEAEVDTKPREAEGASDHTVVWAVFE
ncbi:MAG: exodeoxyribonuclease III [Acidobacteriota bacterium]|nr:exodeoxyribonuclease III [Acidobacteriota bacterium]